MGKIHKYINKKPTWRPEIDKYVVNLRGKAKYASVKNMILVNEKD